MIKSNIIRFKVDAIIGADHLPNWDEPKIDVLNQFDKWKEKENPHILSINFGKISGYYYEDPHHWYIEVLYDKNKD